jgi:triosephosphate isomerase
MFVGGNWKMNTDHAAAVELADEVKTRCAPVAARLDVALFPPFPYLIPVGRTLGHSGVALGAQDVYPARAGAFTGEVGLDMLGDVHVTVVLAGHSERRHVIGETDDVVNRKVLASLDAGLMVVLCIGETIEEREAGRTDEVNLAQLRRGLDGVETSDLGHVVIAYEPVWAIGTGRTASPADAQAAHAVIRTEIGETYGLEASERLRIIYGGSVNALNASDLFAQPDIDGGLIGGASLKADEFSSIVKAASEAD